LVATSATYFEDTNNLAVGATYFYSLRVETLDGAVSDASEEASVVVVDYGANQFKCGGSRGFIRYKNYANSIVQTWTLAPPRPARILLTITSFQLECDHDRVVFSCTNTAGVTSELWRGGCKRQGTFTLSTAADTAQLTVEFSSDASVSFSGLDITYEIDERVIATDVQTIIPCPGPPACGANGACRQGSCACFSGFIGEDCSNLVICPRDLNDCTVNGGHVTCDPVCLQNAKDVVAVSPFGDDVQGTGAMMDTTYSSGKAPKALNTLRRALALVKTGQTIVLYPGTYVGPDNCGLQVAVPNVSIRGLLGLSVTKLDCQDTYNGLMILQNPMVTLSAFTISRAVAAQGGALRVVGSAVSLTDMELSFSVATAEGGALYAETAVVLASRLWISDNGAIRGGAMYLKNTQLTLDGSTVGTNTATDGAALYAASGTVITATSRSLVAWNTASARGGGLFVTGNVRVENVMIRSNAAAQGGGIAVEAGALTIASVIVNSNEASSDGGGLALLKDAQMDALSLTLTFNSATRNGGGILLLTDGAVNFDASSFVRVCSAGALMMHLMVVVFSAF
jgi:hypothetical protein